MGPPSFARLRPCSQGTAVARDADPQAMVRRSRIVSCVTCGLCGGFLRDAAVIPECLHSFCRQCIVEEFTNENISCWPKCDIDWGCKPLKKLRSDRSLQHIRSVMFPDKRHKVGEISHLHPAFVSLPLPSNQAHGIDHSAKKADAHVMPEPMNDETETEADERLGMEPSPLEEIIASSPNTAAAPGAEPAWPDDSPNRQGDEQREEASSALSESESNGEELREAIELCAPIPKHAAQFQELESEHHELVDKQATPQESDELTEEVDPQSLLRRWPLILPLAHKDCSKKDGPRWQPAPPASVSPHDGRESLRATVAGFLCVRQMLSDSGRMQRARVVAQRMHALRQKAAAERDDADAAAAAKDADEARKEADEAGALARAERDRASALTAQVHALDEALQAERARAQALERAERGTGRRS